MLESKTTETSSSLFVDRGAEHHGGLLVEDERGFLVDFRLACGVGDELLGVSGHHGGGAGLHVEEYSVHHGAHLLVGRRVDGVAYAFGEDGRGERGPGGVFARSLDFGVVGGGEVGQSGISVGPDALEGAFSRRLYRDGLVRKGLQQLYHLA